MNEIFFKCPSCGDLSAIKALVINTAIKSTIELIDNGNPMLIFGKIHHEATPHDKTLFMCQCGNILKNAKGRPLDTDKEMIEYMKKNETLFDLYNKTTRREGQCQDTRHQGIAQAARTQ